MLDIVCVKQGRKYTAQYVNTLRDMVQRNLPASFEGRFLCFTDDPAGVECETRPLPAGVTGWWSKLYLFDACRGRTLYFDLDTLIVGPLDDIAAYDGSFAILRDFYRPDGMQSSVMAWNGDFSRIWQAWLDAGRPLLSGGDQEWVEQQIGQVDIWQDMHPGVFASFKGSRCWFGPAAGASVIVFHGEPRPHQVGGWVAEVWKEGGGIVSELKVVSNTPDADLVANITANTGCVPFVERVEAHDGHAVIVAGGPSLASDLEAVRARHEHGQTIFAVNNTATYLTERGIEPDFCVLLDARQFNARFVGPECTYLLATQCHPDVYAKATRALQYHAAMAGLDLPGARIAGGSTAGLKACVLAYLMGYRTLHLYGFDSSYSDGQNHAYAQPENSREATITVKWGNRSFVTASWMAVQADEFPGLMKQLVDGGATVTVAGSGLIPHIARSLADCEIECIDGLWWPSRDTQCRPAVLQFIEDCDTAASYCTQRRTVIQAGGNAGVWPKRLARTFERVVTAEPHPLLWQCLSLNITEDNIEAYQAALGSKPGHVGMRMCDEDNFGAQYVEEGVGSIPIMRIDDLGIDDCDLICLDIEGYELEALKGAQATIERCHPVIVVEDKGLSERYGTSENAIGEWLLRFGYRLADQLNRDKVYTHV